MKTKPRLGQCTMGRGNKAVRDLEKLRGGRMRQSRGGEELGEAG